MLECRNCESLAAEMSAVRAVLERLEQIVLAHTAELTATRTMLESLQKILLGNGQPGWCAEHRTRIGSLERWRAWITGALAVIGVLWVALVAILGSVAASARR